MILQQDKNILQEVGKQYLLNLSYISPLIKSKLTFKEHIKFCNFITELSYKEIIGLIITEDIKEFERKFARFLKLGYAQIAGLGGGDEFGSPKGPPVAMFILYTYRKLTEGCFRSCASKPKKLRRICKYECQVRTSMKVTSKIRSEIGRCSQTKTPDACKKKLEKQYNEWTQRVQQQRIKLNKAKISIGNKIRNQNRIKTIQASFQIPKDRFINLISENENLRNNITFKQHLKIYHAVLNLKTESK